MLEQEPKTYLGIDVGGTKIFGVRADSSGEILASQRVDTRADQGRETVLTNLTEVISGLRDETVVALGLAWAGFVDIPHGIIDNSPHIPKLNGYHLGPELTKQYDLPVYLANDAQLFTLAEARLGQGKAVDNLLGIILGTGVGAGVVVDGHLLQGQSGCAGEIGHQLLDIHSEIEAEELFSAAGMKEFWLSHGLPPDLEAGIAAWQEQTDPAYNIVEDWIKLLAHWLYNLTLAYNQALIIFGGGIGVNVLPPVLAHLNEELTYLFHKHGYNLSADITYSLLENAGAVGAALYAHQKSLNQPHERN